ncbi:MAG: transcription antitermination factor NusB [Clostridia bacterium]|nr:transcription antitermination factor NusB [Clostridia bacterium]
MGRRQARETALQALFQVDVGQVAPEAALEMTCQEFGIGGGDKVFADKLVKGALEKMPELDAVIQKIALEWDLERIAKVDRNILRLALYEMLFEDDIPYNVSVNEAIELAKVFSTEESGKFVNGILGKVVEQPKLYGGQAKTEGAVPTGAELTK